jgi:hypothetical protein
VYSKRHVANVRTWSKRLRSAASDDFDCFSDTFVDGRPTVRHLGDVRSRLTAAG